jgi:hypothetical protein
MSVTTARYVRKPLVVDAVRVTEKNFDEIATWCQGEIRKEESDGTGPGRRYIRIRVHYPKNIRQTKAFVGDWILYTDKGYKVYVNQAFITSFDELSKVEEPISYPYDGGGITVLGPELFASQDGATLCWKGVNYVRQDSFSPVNESQGELLSSNNGAPEAQGSEKVT